MTGPDRRSLLSAHRRELLSRSRSRPAPPAGTARRAGDLPVPIKRDGGRPPIFLVPAVSGSPYAYLPLGRHLHPDQPAETFQARGLDGDRVPLTSIEEIAADHLGTMRRHSPTGPYLLAGWSFGGTVAFEMARQLRRAGEDVAVLAIIEGAVPGPYPVPRDAEVERAFLADLGEHGVTAQALGDDLLRVRLAVFRANMRAHRAYRPRPWDGPATVVHGSDSAEPWSGWRRWLTGRVSIRAVPGDHYTMWAPENLPVLAEALEAAITGSGRPPRVERP